MTAQEARMFLEIIATNMLGNSASVNDEKLRGLMLREYDALDTAIEALEKQIPKKPKTEPFYGGRCIVCNALIPNKSINYCHECGQKFDWGD